MLRLFVKKTGQTYDVGEFDRLPETSRQYLIQYGVNQSGTDSHASVVRKDWKGTEAEFVAEVDKSVRAWIAKIQSGNLRVQTVEDPEIVTRRFLESRGMTQAQIDTVLAKTPAAKKSAA